MKQPILMTEEYWVNSQFSVVRYTGSMKWNGVVYVICKVDGVLLHKCDDKAKGDVRRALECVNNGMKK